jgi:CBS domain-containing protein
MGSHGVGALLVVSGAELLGIVTDRDIVVRGVGTGQLPDAHVNTVMTEKLITVQGSADLFETFHILRDAGVRRLPSSRTVTWPGLSPSMTSLSGWWWSSVQ